MLVRAASAVGYTNYPDNVVRSFIKESADAGIDLFRVFDALNWSAQSAIGHRSGSSDRQTVRGRDLLHRRHSRSDAVQILTGLLCRFGEAVGAARAHILAIKDMAGLCKPYAAQQLVRALRQEVGLPIHFHTHDCAGGQIASYLMAAGEGVDVVDCAFAPFSGMTSQPNLNALVEALKHTPRDIGLDAEIFRQRPIIGPRSGRSIARSRLA